MKSVVSEKGQVTIPKSVRDRLGLRPGVVIEFGAERGVLVGRKRVAADPLSRWRGRGRLPAGVKNVDAYLALARGSKRAHRG